MIINIILFKAECLTLKIGSMRTEPQNQECSSSHGMTKQQQKESTKGESLSQVLAMAGRFMLSLFFLVPIIYELTKTEFIKT